MRVSDVPDIVAPNPVVLPVKAAETIANSDFSSDEDTVPLSVRWATKNRQESIGSHSPKASTSAQAAAEAAAETLDFSNSSFNLISSSSSSSEHQRLNTSSSSSSSSSSKSSDAPPHESPHASASTTSPAPSPSPPKKRRKKESYKRIEENRKFSTNGEIDKFCREQEQCSLVETHHHQRNCGSAKCKNSQRVQIFLYFKKIMLRSKDMKLFEVVFCCTTNMIK